MRIPFTGIALSLAVCVSATPVTAAHEFSGYVAAEGRIFFDDPLYGGQEAYNVSIAAQPEYYHEWESGSSFIFAPFARLDSADPRRSHFDVRELNYLWLTDDWELRLGVGKVFWGVTEFAHLVDIINQTDLIEHIDTEDKLGQPMVHLSVPRDWGVVDLFVLPYFRERTFPGPRGRLRPGMYVDTSQTTYESGDKERHIDFAARYSRTIGDWDIGISHFTGTGREPTLLPGTDSIGRPVLTPFYPQINQTGLDAQFVAGQWLWKLEALYRTGQGRGFFAGIGGFEYTFVGVRDSAADLSIVGEYAYDDRGAAATTPYENDVVLGCRLGLNDIASTEILAGVMQDLDSPTRGLQVEASRRIGSNWRLSLELWLFLNPAQDDLLYNVRDDDFARLELAYYF
ncbi:MAG: hypothetical protein JSU70_16305 [Phycisphaerales bacterium]|nr:MAG: hypothetical protein JSU70_16305 [Phycisphaerales bacterium]